jgi:tetratricopeptide (TPR) repeat protein
LILGFYILSAPLQGYTVLEQNGALLKAVELNDEKQFPESIAILNELVGDGYEIRQPFVLFQLGRAWKGVGKSEKSFEDFEKSLSYFKQYRDGLKPDSPEFGFATLSLVYAMLDVGQVNEAYKIITLFIKDHPNEIGAKKCLALAANTVGYEILSSDKPSYSKAFDKFEEACENDKVDTYFNNQLEAYGNLISNVPIRTRRDLRKRLENSFEHVYPILNPGTVRKYWNFRKL